MTQRSPFRYFKTSPEIIRLAEKVSSRVPASLRGLDELQHRRGIEVSRETVCYCWDWLCKVLAAELQRKWVDRMSGR
jgi:putative transposase